ncbi:sodium:proton antiporter [Erythrobacter gaetbuli]|uniref:Sodium:proton antiporter n=1 Tax=Qipengyuania gaetbuli TaxID=266952 RepID=A0A844Y2F8_9SPHN|nr:sodium:proton antiporter [Qipengyuania gaetbuli]MXO52016.1 sodium:proton antiporter [Qipengyuania gaetbuli]
MEQTLVIALVGILGIGAQWLAWRTGWPAIVLMLAAGFLAGPVLGVFDPEHAFGELLEPMVAVGVALILFEGGLSLDFRELRHTGSAVMRLATVGVVLGWLFGSLAGIYIAGLAPEVAILFGGILVVTGPTVVIPLLRQSSVKSRPASILKWEAIVNDPTGALCAVIAFEYFRKVAEQPNATLFEVVPPLIIAAIIAGIIGYVAALAIAWSFPRGAVPEYLKVPVLLTAVIGVFVISNLIEHEAGLVAVTVMGVALANMHVSSLRSIHPFKENIAILLVSGIFILLSASLSFEDIRLINWPIVAFLLALLFVVRPATILISLLGTNIPWNERLFLSWIAPRGIVLVAISGLFALRLAEPPLAFKDANLLIGLSFAVVVVTIVAHGFTVNLVARLLNVKGATRPGILIVGSTPWTIALAEQVRDMKAPVIIVDASWQRLALARQKGIPFYHGEILNEATEHNLELAPYQNLVAATENEAYNALVCNEFAFEIGRDKVFQLGEAAQSDDRHSLPESLRGRALFESGFGVEDVSERQRQGWVFRKTKLSDEFDFEDARERLPDAANMLLLIRRDGTIRFFTHAARPEPRAGDTILSFLPPQPRTAEDNAARRKPGKKQGTQTA